MDPNESDSNQQHIPISSNQNPRPAENNVTGSAVPPQREHEDDIIRNQIPAAVTSFLEEVQRVASDTANALTEFQSFLSSITSSTDSNNIPIKSTTRANEPEMTETILETETAVKSEFDDEWEKYLQEEETKRREEERQYEEEKRKRIRAKEEQVKEFVEKERRTEKERNMELEEKTERMEKDRDELRKRLAEEEQQREKNRQELIADGMQKMHEDNLEIEEDMKQKRTETEIQLEEVHEIIAEKRKEHWEQMDEKSKEASGENTEHKERMKRIREEYEKQREKSRKMWDERRRKLQEQCKQLELMLKYQVWNEIVEGNWTNRLNFLRSANREVSRCWADLLRTTRALSNSLNLQDAVAVEQQKTLVLAQVGTMIDAVIHEKELMNQESETLGIMFSNTGKQFLCQIRLAVNTISLKCAELNACLQQFSGKLNEKSVSVDSFLLNEISEQCGDLAKLSSAVPTLSELKETFRDQERESRRDGEEQPEFQTVLVEEVE